MNKFLNKYKANDYVLLFSAGAAVGTLFLWAASYIFPEGEIVGGRRVFENIPCLLYTSPSPRDGLLSRMPSSA